MRIDKGATYEVTFRAKALNNGDLETNKLSYLFGENLEATGIKVSDPRPAFKVGDKVRHKFGHEYTVVPGAREGQLAVVGLKNGHYFPDYDIRDVDPDSFEVISNEG